MLSEQLEEEQVTVRKENVCVCCRSYTRSCIGLREGEIESGCNECRKMEERRDVEGGRERWMEEEMRKEGKRKDSGLGSTHNTEVLRKTLIFFSC